MKSNSRRFVSQLDLETLKGVLSHHTNGAELFPLSYGPLAQVPDFHIGAQRSPLLKRDTVIKVEAAFLEEGGIGILLTALGDGFFGTLTDRTKSINFAASVKWRDEVIESLRSLDPHLTEVFD